MAKTTSKIHNRHLFCYPDPQPLCAVGSPTWFAWLETATAFRYCSGQRQNVCNGYGPLLAPVSFRKERRRLGWLWYAHRRVHGMLHKRYVGRSDRLTAMQLEMTAVLLNEV
jgi:LuxR family transcriptional regulator, maltose regulon positive regulatory protein